MKRHRVGGGDVIKKGYEVHRFEKPVFLWKMNFDDKSLVNRHENKMDAFEEKWKLEKCCCRYEYKVLQKWK